MATEGRAVGLLLLAACARSGPAQPRATAAAPAQASAFFLGPGDFAQRRAVFDLEPAPGGTTTLVVVPALGIADYRDRRDLAALTVPITLGAQDIPRIDRRVGHALPLVRTGAAVSPVGAPPPACPVHEPPMTRVFHVWSTRSRRYVVASGSRSYLGRAYAFYDDDTNGMRLRPDEYAALDGVLEQGASELVALFGPWTDVDCDGHVLVFMSRTAVQEQPEHPADVDSCTVFGDPECGAAGEIVVSWSLDGLEAPGAERSARVRDELAATLLHETVHLSQHAAAVRAGVARSAVSLPPWVREGQAQLASFVTGVGLEALWAEASSEVRLGPPFDSPFFRPYGLGVLPFRWVEERSGPDAQRGFLAASVDPRVADPFAMAFGLPEPLVLAEMYASLRFDGTPFAHETGLEFPRDDIPGRLGGPLPRTRVRPDDPPATAEVRLAGHADFGIAHGVPVRVTLTLGIAQGAYVVVARP